MNAVLLGLGVMGVIAAIAWYGWLLNDASPSEHVPFLSAGAVTRESIMLWLLLMLLSLSVVVAALDVTFTGVTLVATIVLTAIASDGVRRWHNRGLPAEPDGDSPPPTQG
jgi:uncharacterized membrane protein YbaN (DUF454 family)